MAFAPGPHVLSYGASTKPMRGPYALIRSANKRLGGGGGGPTRGRGSSNKKQNAIGESTVRVQIRRNWALSPVLNIVNKDTEIMKFKIRWGALVTMLIVTGREQIAATENTQSKRLLS
jgi:hypothetical protein